MRQTDSHYCNGTHKSYCTNECTLALEDIWEALCLTKVLKWETLCTAESVYWYDISCSARSNRGTADRSCSPFEIVSAHCTVMSVMNRIYIIQPHTLPVKGIQSNSQEESIRPKDTHPHCIFILITIIYNSFNPSCRCRVHAERKENVTHTVRQRQQLCTTYVYAVTWQNANLLINYFADVSFPLGS